MTLHHHNSRLDPPRHRGDNPSHNYDPYSSEDRESPGDGSQSRFRALSTRLLLLAGFLSAIFVLPTAVRAQDQQPQLVAEPGTTVSAEAPNLLVNGEFSDQTGWSTCAGADESAWDIAEDHLRVLGIGPACVYQTVRATVNVDYQLRCESYEETTGQQTLIRLSVLDENWQTLQDVVSPVAVGSSVTSLSTTAEGGAAHIGVTVDSPGSGYSSYGYCQLNPSAPDGDVPVGDGGSGGVDDGTPDGNSDTGEPVPPPAGNLLVNGDFTVAAGWDNCDSASDQQTIDGQLIITASASSPACIYQEVPIERLGTGQNESRTFELSCTSTVSTGYASLTLNALNSAYARLASEVSEGADLGQPITLTAPPDTSFLAVTFYGEGFSTHDDCVLTVAGSGPNPNPDPDADPDPSGPAGEVTVTADEFAGYQWDTLPPGTVVNLSGNFQAGIMLDQRHSGLVFDGGHTIDGADGWIAGAVLDGTGYNAGSSHPGAIRIDGAKGVTVRNFKIGNYASQTISTDPKAIYVLGDSANVVIETNEIFGFSSVHQADCHTADLESLERCGTAHGILVATWDSPSTPIVGVGIFSNRIYNMDLGKSEALTVVGNVRDFNIKYNQIYNVNNIGIDVAGFADDDGVFRTTSNGVVEGNTVYKVDTRGNQGLADGVPSNQAYFNLETGRNNQSAACIYVDGGRDVVVLANRVHQCNIGISINGETETADAAGSTSARNVTIEGNLVYDSSTTGFKLGSRSNEQGGVDGCDVRNNAFYTNDAPEAEVDFYHNGLGEIWIEDAVRNCTIRDNNFLANAVRPQAGPGGPKTVFANTMLLPGPGTFVFTNNRFYYQGEPSDDVARCQWITFTNDSMRQCMANLNSGGGSGNEYTPIPRPEPLLLPTPVNY